MPGAVSYVQNLPKWFIFVAGATGVAAVGMIDYLTGDYSLLIFYLLPVSFVAWFAGPLRGACIAILSGIARLNADYATFSNKNLLYWNSCEDLLFLIISAILIAQLQKALGSGRSN